MPLGDMERSLLPVNQLIGAGGMHGVRCTACCTYGRLLPPLGRGSRGHGGGRMPAVHTRGCTHTRLLVCAASLCQAPPVTPSLLWGCCRALMMDDPKHIGSTLHVMLNPTPLMQ